MLSPQPGGPGTNLQQICHHLACKAGRFIFAQLRILVAKQQVPEVGTEDTRKLHVAPVVHKGNITLSIR